MAKVHSQPFMSHIQELRRRLGWSAAILLVGAILGYVWRKPIIEALAQPLNMPLYYTSPAGGFEFVMQVCILVGGLIALPVLIYNIIRFLEPAFQRKRFNRTQIGIIISISSFLAAAGVSFAYLIVLPASIHFFSLFNVGPVSAWISTKEYFTFATSYLMLMALLFQLPLILLIANSIRRFPPGSIGKFRRWVIVGSFVIALPLTYDMLSQALMAIPIIVLYEASGLIIWFKNRRYNKRQEAKGPQASLADTAQLPPEQVAVTEVDELQEDNHFVEEDPVPAALPTYKSKQTLDGRRVVQLG